MTKAWQSALDLHSCAVGIYTAAGTLLTDAQVTAAGLTVTENADGSVSLTGPLDAAIYYLRLTPNYGNGVGSSALRLTTTGTANLASASPRWDGGGAWDAFTGNVSLAEPETADWTYIEIPLSPSGAGATALTVLAEVYFDELVTAQFNCTCVDAQGGSFQTLLQLRQRLMVRLGFGNQLANPPPGVAALMDSFLYDAQVLYYQRAPWLLANRFFSWPLLAGVRLYDFPDNAEPCSAKLDPTKITRVAVVRDGIWYTMRGGIEIPQYGYDTIEGIPTQYAIRSCIEIWPKPDVTEGSLVIQGDMGLLPFADDSDTATINDTLIFLLALGNAKAHYRQPDADRYIQQAEVFLNNLVAGSHATNRYVPGRDRNNELVYVQPKPAVPFTD
jgi:hypothetical protein